MTVKRVTINIDGQELKAPEGSFLLWAALENGIYIPHLCARQEKARPSACCRLCFVEVEGVSQPVTSCTWPVSQGLVVKTRGPRVDRLVRSAFELLLSDHRLGCSQCPARGGCALQKIARERGLKLKLTRLRPLERQVEIDQSAPSFVLDRTRCVLCGRCVWADRHKARVGAIGFSRRGIHRQVSTFGDIPLADTNCTDCGECVRDCPVGALAFKQGAAGSPKGPR